jgi:methylmalonyl-CoA/ethylmalonyl-CoA epimerase
MNVQRIDHVVFAVQDLQAAARAWADTFGLQAEPVALPEGIPLELAALAVGADEQGAFLELASATSPEGPIASHIDQRGEGMLSFSLQVADLDAAVRDLRAKGVTVSDPGPGLLPQTRIARIDRASAHGVALQLIERGAS